MKKLFAIAAVVAVALTSCVKNEVITPAGGEVTFKTYALGENTRANADFKTVADNFECFAIYESETGARSHFWKSGGAETVAYNATGNIWVNSEGPAYYWPKDGNIDFYAYYHPNLTDAIAAKIHGNTTEALGMTISNLTIDEAQGLLIADPAKDNHKNSVPLVFRHTTARLGFYFANNDNLNANSTFQLTINSIVVDGVNQTANYKFDETNKHEWTPVAPANKEILASDAPVYNKLIDASTAPIATLEVFPQAEQQVTIKYTVVDNNGFQYTGTYVINVSDTDNWTAWKANYDYHYNINFNFTMQGSESLLIQFVPEVEEWTAVDNYVVDDVRQY